MAMKNDGMFYAREFSPCENCKHLRKMGNMAGNGWKCDAFPEGIDSKIVKGITSHEFEEEANNEKNIHYESKIYGSGNKKYSITWSGKIVDVKEVN